MSNKLTNDNFSFLTTIETDMEAIYYNGTSINYSELKNLVDEKHHELGALNGKKIVINYTNPIQQITMVLAVIEAGGYAIVTNSENEISEESLVKVFNKEELYITTDNEEVLVSTILQQLAVGVTSEKSVEKGGVILVNNSVSEVYQVEMNEIQEHVSSVIQTLELEKGAKVLATKALTNVDVLEYILPAITAQATLYISNETARIVTEPKGIGTLKITTKELNEETLEKLSNSCDFEVTKVIIAANEKVSGAAITKLKAAFPKIEKITAVYQLKNIYYSVLQSDNLLDLKENEIAVYTKPIGKINVQILDAKLRPAPVGVLGELWIESKILNTPLIENAKMHELYIGGADRKLRVLEHRAKFESGGKIALLNKKDRELLINEKIITPDVTEENLQLHPQISKAAVVFQEAKNLLVAFIEIAKGEELTVTTVRNWIKRKVSRENIPAHFEFVDKLPVLNNDIDYTLLENTEVTILPKAEVSAEQQQLITIWEELLGVSAVELDDNFFELGGHSILATKLAAIVKNKFGQSISIKDVFLRPVLSDLLKFITETSTKEEIQITNHHIKEGEKTSLSYSQEGLWFIDKFQGSIQYNVPGLLTIKGNLDTDSLESALKDLIERHKALRTVFIEENGKVYQVVKNNEWKLDYKKVASYEEAVNEVEELIKIPFNLSKDYMIKGRLLQYGEEEFVLGLSIHHIVFDGWSAYLLLDEMKQLYEAKTKGVSLNLPHLPIDYADYSIWQRSYISGDYLEKETAYWKSQLQGLDNLDFPTDYPRPAQQRFVGNRKTFTINTDLRENLVKISQSEGVTLFMTMLASFKVLLYKYTGQNDICVGSPIAGRNQSELESLIGFLANTLALRTNLTVSESFTQLLHQVKDITLDAYLHQEVPFEKIVDAIGVKRETSKTPIFQIMFSMEDVPDLTNMKMGDLLVSSQPVEQNTTQFDINVYMEDGGERGMEFHVEYDTDLFSLETISRFGQHYINLLKEIVDNPERTIKELSILTGNEVKELIYDFNNTETDFSFDLTTDQIIDKIAEIYPEKVALKDELETRIYRDLKVNASKQAALLKEQLQINEEEIIAILSDRSVVMLESIYGVWKAGGVYLPIHPDLPEDRIKVILEDANVTTLLYAEKYTTLVTNLLQETTSVQNVICLNGTAALSSTKVTAFGYQDIQNQEPTKNSYSKIDNLAYAIYTSGSTGKPKGALLEHKGMLNHLLIMVKDLEISEKSNISQNASQSFDISVWQMVTALIVGGTTAVYSNLETLNVHDFVTKLKNDQISHLQVVPSYLSILLDEIDTETPEIFSQLQYLLVTGETVKKNVLERWFNKFKNIKVVNAYGPTEAADDVTLHIMSEKPSTHTISIGKPLANLNIYIVNEDEQLCPVGVKGEIWVSGVGVGRGYINDVEKTQKVFTIDPFKRGERLYKTGDIGKYLSDGSIEFYGRKDYQVKVRGYRIELEEIEQHLTKLEEVKEAIVIVLQKEGQLEQLYGFVTGYQNNIDAEELRQKLSASLPDYMIPSKVLVLDKFPLTPNGKIDRKKLAVIEEETTNEIESKTEKALTAAEEALVNVWKEVLEVSDVDVHSNFFEIGGHSLKVVSMISQIQKHLGAEIAISDVFIRPTIKLLAELIDESNKVQYEPIPLIKEAAFYPVSNAQKRLWVLDRFVDDVSGYNSYEAYHIKGKINVEAFGNAILSVVNRHEVLRTTFKEKKGEPVQIIHNSYKKEQVCKVIDYANTVIGFDEVMSELKVIANTPFDLDKPSLFQSRIYRLNEDEYVFFCSMHHIICDGWSVNILIKEILSNYSAFENNEASSLPELNLQYKDYAAWQLNKLTSKEYKKHKEYWHNQLGNNLPVLNFPSYNHRPPVQVFNGSAIEYVFNKDILNGLKAVGKTEEASLFMVLAAVLNVLLYKYTSQTDIVLGTGTAGRTHPDLENQLGYYINTLALRNELNPEQSFIEFLKKVKNNTIKAFEHQDYPFDVLVNELDFERDISRNPIFDVIILLQSFDEDKDDLLINGFKEAHIKQVTVENQGTPFDMDFDFIEKKDELKLTLSYNNIIYNGDQMNNLIRHMEQLMLEIINNSSQKTSQITVVTQEELALISEINETNKELPLESTFHHYLEKYAKETPQKNAVIFEEKTISYDALNKQVNQFARALANQLQVKADDQIAILLDRSDLVMTTVLSVWKLGGAYIPVDKKVPDNRVLSMLEIGGVTAIIADKNLISTELANKISSICKLIYIQDLVNESTSQKDDNLNIEVTPYSLSVTMFTSGSTGLPKGAMNEHIGMMNHALATVDYLQMDENAVLVQNASLSFDIAVWQLFTALITGGTTAIYGDSLVNAPEKLLEKMKEHKVTVFQVVPSYLSMLLEIISEDVNKYPLSITHLICCGEAIKPKSIAKWLTYYPSTTFINDYGPAEASDGTTWNVFTNVDENATTIPIGKPIYNMSNYIVDDAMNLCPVGVVGEICVGGIGVGRGYINEPEKTAKVFVTNPFKEGVEERLYKTGDLGKLLPNGMIEFHGRKDYQVKVNGQRIELGEIEAKLVQLSNVADAAVIDRINNQNGRKYLHAFIVFEEENKSELLDVKMLLSKELPPYMIPSDFQQINELPVTMSGKVDRRYLERIASEKDNQVGSNFIAPETEIEKILVEAWQSTLKLEKVGVTDNFYEIGGDSISAIQVSSYLYKHQYQVEVKDIMRYPVIKEVSNFVKPLQRIAEQGVITGSLALTPIQIAFFQMDKNEPDYYNQSVLIESKERVNTITLAETLSLIQHWHDALRTTFKTTGLGIEQTIQDDNLPVVLKEFELPNVTNIEDIKELAVEVQSSISLEEGALMQSAVFKTKEVDYILLAIHHLVVDAVSWRIILEDFITIYEQLEIQEEPILPAKTDSFKVWSDGLTDFMYSEAFDSEKNFWNKRVNEIKTELIPYDFGSYEIGKVEEVVSETIQLGQEYVNLLETKGHQAFNTDINDILLAALSESVYKCFGLKETAILLESHGRAQISDTINVSRTVGWFTSEYPICLPSTTNNQELSDLIKSVKEHLHKIPNNGIGFGLLRYNSMNENNAQELLLPQIAFNYLGNIDENDNNRFTVLDTHLGIDESPNNQSDYPIEFLSYMKNGTIEFTLNYHSSHFKEETIKNWLGIYVKTLEELIDYCAKREHSEATPSDYDYSDLSLDDLVELNDLF